jgi:hypothetical protein
MVKSPTVCQNTYKQLENTLEKLYNDQRNTQVFNLFINLLLPYIFATWAMHFRMVNKRPTNAFNYPCIDISSPQKDQLGSLRMARLVRRSM